MGFVNSNSTVVIAGFGETERERERERKGFSNVEFSADKLKSKLRHGLRWANRERQGVRRLIFPGRVGGGGRVSVGGGDKSRRRRQGEWDGQPWAKEGKRLESGVK